MNSYEEIREELASMSEAARADNLWFYCGYQNLWLSPYRLDQLQQEGAYRWPAGCWTLRDPRERLEELRKQTDVAMRLERDFERSLLAAGIEVRPVRRNW